jgi:hypothetical protein
MLINKNLVGLVLAIISSVLVGWFSLSWVSMNAREADLDPHKHGPILADFTTATDWAADILGLATTIAGLLGIAAAGRSQKEDRAQIAEAGMIGLLAGGTLLEVGDLLFRSHWQRRL